MALKLGLYRLPLLGIFNGTAWCVGPDGAIESHDGKDFFRHSRYTHFQERFLNYGDAVARKKAENAKGKVFPD